MSLGSSARKFSLIPASPSPCFRNLPKRLASLFSFTLLTDGFIRLQTVRPFPDGATSLVSLSIPGEISNPRQMQRRLVWVAEAHVSGVRVPAQLLALAFLARFSDLVQMPCSNEALIESEAGILLLSNSFF